MPTVLVRDLPENVHANLQRRAEAEGKSLQQYLTSELTRLASTPTLHDVLDRIARRRGGTVGFAAAVHDLDEERRQG
jgi:plasmid stability protein